MSADSFAARGIVVRVIVLVTPFLVVLGLLLATGALSDSQRDQPVWLTAAVALALVAGVLLALEPGVERGRSARRLKVVGATAAVVSIGIAVVLAASNSSPESRPLISASFDDQAEVVTGTVSAANLPANGRLVVRVDHQAIRDEQGVDDPSPFSPTGSLPMERATVGPDGDGNAVHEFTVPVLTDSVYTHIVIEATSGSSEERRCIELESPSSPDDQTACMFIALR